MDTKVCLNCKEELDLSCFSKWKNRSPKQQGVQTWCKQCVKSRSQTEYHSERKRNNIRKKREDLEYRNREREVNKATRHKNRAVTLLRSARYRAIKLNLEFNLTVSDITIPTHCPILGEPMIVLGRYAASIDRIDSTKGYIKGNVWVISRKANIMKSDATMQELLRFSNYWINNK